MLSPTSTAGYYNAPFNKIATLTVGGCSVLASILKIKHIFPLRPLPFLLNRFEIHRLFTSHLVFQSSGELLFGGLLLYHFRVLERLFGSRKYSAFIFITTAISTFLEVIILALFKSFDPSSTSRGNPILTSGPYTMIFANLYLYHHRIPENDKFVVFSLNFSQKSFVYLMATQLLMFSGSLGLIPALCGFISGSVYVINPFNLQSWRFPRMIDNLTHRIIGPIITQNPARPARAINPEPPRSNVARNRSMMEPAALDRTGMHRDNPDTDQQPISEENVHMLVSMGFQRDRAIEVLGRVNGDMNRAVQALL